MENQEQHLKDLQEIRSMMERSSRFISLSGLSGVCAGVFALVGAALVYIKAENQLDYVAYYMQRSNGVEFRIFLFIDALAVLAASLLGGYFFTARKARRDGLPMYDATAKRLLFGLGVPLVTGGLFCLILLYYNLLGLIPASMLIFYGLGLLNGSKFTLPEIGYLGICQIILGLVSALYIGYGLFFWAFGFGVLHIVYGVVMYLRYERNED